MMSPTGLSLIIAAFGLFGVGFFLTDHPDALSSLLRVAARIVYGAPTS